MPKERRRKEKAAQPEEVHEEKPRKFDPIPLLRGAFDMAVEEGGWANLATIGFYLRQLDPGFDPRTYGYKQLSQLIKSYPDLFELKFRGETGKTDVFVRLKET